MTRLSVGFTGIKTEYERDFSVQGESFDTQYRFKQLIYDVMKSIRTLPVLATVLWWLQGTSDALQ